MQERGVSVDYSTIHRWVLKYAPQFEAVFYCRKDPSGAAGAWTKHILRDTCDTTFSRPYLPEVSVDARAKMRYKPFVHLPGDPSAHRRRATPPVAMNEWWPTPNEMTIGDVSVLRNRQQQYA